MITKHPNPTPTKQENWKVIICPRNYTGWTNVSHTGLGVSAKNTAKVLKMNHNINTNVFPITGKDDLVKIINSQKPTHVVINALWMQTSDLYSLVTNYPHIVFAVNCHSNIAFLQVEPNGINLLRQAIDLEMHALGNFRVAMNSLAGAQALGAAYECPCAYLPNLYYLDHTVRPTRRTYCGGTMRIGAFGALRPLKNPTASAFAALVIAGEFHAALEFHINVGRKDGPPKAADSLLSSVRSIFNGLPNAKIVEDPWTDWPQHRRIIQGMHLLLQPSFTESFNMITADGVAEGIPSVCGDCIEWVPSHWQAHADDVEDIARVGRQLISDSKAGSEGLQALINHNSKGVTEWVRYLSGEPQV